MRILDDLLREAKDAHASDVHLAVGRIPFFRIDGALKPVGEQVLSKEEMDVMVKQMLGDRDFTTSAFAAKQQVDLSYALDDGTRFRVNIFLKIGVMAAALRLISSTVYTLEQLHLPPQLAQLAEIRQGFVLAVGPAGHGKSTTLAALIQHINMHRREHIMTIEDPIEYQFTEAQSLIDQREVGRDAASFPEAVRAVLRQDPNVIMIGELRDLETMQTAITVAETGHLVFGTLHTNDAAQTVERLIDSFPSVQQAQIRSQLAVALSGVISQRLLPWTEGGRIPAIEIMVATPAIRNVIREGNVHHIMGIIQTSSEAGMQTLDASLEGLVDAGAVRQEDAQYYFSGTKTLNR